MFTYLVGGGTPCWRNEVWAVASAARVLCQASRATSQRICVDKIPICSGPLPKIQSAFIFPWLWPCDRAD